MPRVGIENEIYGKTTMNPSTRYLVALERDYNFFSKKYHQGLLQRASSDLSQNNSILTNYIRLNSIFKVKYIVA